MEAVMKALLISMVMFIIGTFLFFLYAYVYNIKLGFYLKKEKYNRWRELTTIGRFGPGGVNPFKGFRYLYSDLDNEDEVVLRYKDSIKFGLRQSLFILIALVINATILAVLIIRSKQ